MQCDLGHLLQCYANEGEIDNEAIGKTIGCSI